ncbi:adenylate cyclase-associated CAP [Chytridium lagenaria]|nr:adenylate cyclase-associated CAP [Chytridium lagenaria]
MASEQTLSAVIKRLETATLRLEEIVRSKEGAEVVSHATRDISSSAADAKVIPTVAAFDELINGPLQTLLDLANSIGGLVHEQASHLKDAFFAQRAMIEIAANSKKPSDVPTLQALLAPTQKEIEAVVTLREKNRPSALFNHLSVLSEGIPALGWVVIPAPAPYVNEYKDSAQFYSNRVLKENSDKKEHTEFVKTFGTLLTELSTYVKKNHTTGLTWNPKGVDAKSYTPSSAPASVAAPSSAPAASAAAPTPSTAPLQEQGPDKSGLFGALNKDGLTSGLRKVDKSEMTHKNPELRAGSVVPAVEKPAVVASKFSQMYLAGNKWSVENFTNDSNVVVNGVELRHVVYIYNCTNSTIVIRGKVNA